MLQDASLDLNTRYLSNFDQFFNRNFESSLALNTLVTKNQLLRIIMLLNTNG